MLRSNIIIHKLGLSKRKSLLNFGKQASCVLDWIFYIKNFEGKSCNSAKFIRKVRYREAPVLFITPKIFGVGGRSSLKSIAFIDTEISPKSKKILDIGGIKGDGMSFHSNSVADFKILLMPQASTLPISLTHYIFRFFCFLPNLITPCSRTISCKRKRSTNPLNDSLKAKDLFFDEVTAFQQADPTLKVIYHALLKAKKEFSAFFHFLVYQGNTLFVEKRFEPSFIATYANGSILHGSYPNTPWNWLTV